MGFEAGSLPDFALMKAITFVDTVISHELLTDSGLWKSSTFEMGSIPR
jgi:hypothetical protein